MLKLERSRLVILFSIISAVLFIPSAAAEEAAPVSGPEEPAETEIILPEMYLEIEDLSIEEIYAVIPDNDSVLLSSLELPLPEPDQIEIPAEVFAVSEMDAPQVSLQNGQESGSSFFSESTIGVGTSSNITGDINLYHIGEQPDFRIRYFHDSYDGFAKAEAGKGFSTREELIEAELNYAKNSLSADILLTYNEIEDGLQGNSDYFSLTRRMPELDADINWSVLDNLAVTGNLAASSAGYQLNSLAPEDFNIFSLSPEAGIVFGGPQLNAGLMIDYTIAGEFGTSGLNQGLGARLLFNTEPSDLIKISAEAGLLWDNFAELFFPFRVEVFGTTASLEYSLGGGLDAFYTDRAELWKDFPEAAGPESLSSLGSIPLTAGWSADGGIRWNLNEQLAVRGSAAFSMYENAVIPAASGLTGFNTLAFTDSTCFSTAAGAYVRITDNFTFDLGWTGQLLSDIDWFAPRHLIQSEFELTSDNRDMGIIGNAELRFYDAGQNWYVNDWMPVVGFEAYLRLAEGFMLSVSGEDLGAGFIADGRNRWNGYLDKGTVLQTKIKISL